MHSPGEWPNRDQGPKEARLHRFEREKCRERHHFSFIMYEGDHTTTGFQEASEKWQRQEKKYEGWAGGYHSGCELPVKYSTRLT